MESPSSMQLIRAAALAVFILTVPAANAAAIFDATLLGSTEVPPTGSPATGLATLTLTGNTLEVALSFSGLVGGSAVAAHIHCCTPPGSNAAVAIPLLGFPAATSGSYLQNFDLTNIATYSAAFVTTSGGTAASAEAFLLAGFEGGTAYLNIHDVVFPGGEIRGLIVPSTVPEPGSLTLLGLGLAGIALRRRRMVA